MGKILIPGGGGGADLDVITATAADVRKNKVIVDREGEPLAGTMKEMAGGTYTPGTADVVLVPANTFVTAPIIMKGDRNLVAGNIKKNVTIFNITGSFEGWVAGNGELYRYGNNAAGFAPSTYHNVVVFDSGQITVNCTNSALNMQIDSSQSYNTGPWNYVNVLLDRTESIGSGTDFSPGIQIKETSIYPEGSSNMGFLNFYGERNVRFPLKGLSVTSTVKLFAYRFKGTIKRIYFS